MTTTTVLALSTNQTLWWVTLGLGLVVAVVLWALLASLKRAVLEVEERVLAAWHAGQRVEHNTMVTHMIKTTRERGADLAAELDLHLRALGKR